MCSAIVVALLGLVPAGWADTIQIDDTGDGVEVYGGSNVTQPDNYTVLFDVDTGLAAGGTGTYYKAIDDADGSLSGLFALSESDGSSILNAAFYAQGSSTFPNPVPSGWISLGSIVADGTYQTVAHYYNLQNGEVIDTFQVAAPASGTEGAPEPSTSLLAGLAIAVFAVIRRVGAQPNSASASRGAPLISRISGTKR